VDRSQTDAGHPQGEADAEDQVGGADRGDGAVEGEREVRPERGDGAEDGDAEEDGYLAFRALCGIGVGVGASVAMRGKTGVVELLGDLVGRAPARGHGAMAVR